MEGTIAIRINYKDWKELQKLFPKESKDETMRHYIERYVKAMKEKGK